ncbi:AAA family ATPase [Lacipirellula sp.]|uniref:AAA family ATPase n=1 Tax=Lacipirellula sp. TaxID=2691419 RepID=UPI003D125475
MTKLKKINLVGFRGVKTDMSLDLTANTKSVAIFGDNGTGKSSITDAIEWFFSNKVDHLWREDCKSHSLRNVHLAAGDKSSVAIEFRNGPPAGTRTLTDKLAAKLTPASEELKNYLIDAGNERLILRHQELTQFVSMSKGDKRRFVAEIMGYDAVIAFRDVILATLGGIRNTLEYTSAKGRIENHRAELLSLAGEIVTTDQAYYGRLRTLLEELDVKLEEETSEAVLKAEATLNARIKQEEKAKRKLLLQGLSKKLASLIEELEALNLRRDDFTPKYETLIESVEQLKEIKLGDFLRKGKEIIAEDESSEECPFCLTKVDLAKVGESVDARIRQLEKTQAKQQAAKDAMTLFVQALKDVERVCGELNTLGPKGVCSDTFVKELVDFAKALKEHTTAVPMSFTSYESIVESAALTKAEKAVRAALVAEKKTVDEAEEKEKLTHEETAIVELLKKIDGIRSHYKGHQDDSAIISSVETQITSLETTLEEFLKVQSEAMQNALDVMSSDIGKFYSAMHPSENTEGVHLSIVGDEGVEFHYTFHGEKVHPPMKYLSESHLNSLGIALFLASVKLFNKTSKFFVLDDIVSSFDIGHRRRLLRLLQDEFSDWQIILLTHEYLWFEIIRREMAPHGWLLKEVTWDAPNGSMLDETHATFRELVEKKRKLPGVDIENDLRKLLENVLKELCQQLGVKVAYRPNEVNDKRMPGELLPELKSTLDKRKCTQLKSHAIFPKLEGSAFIANFGSHDNLEKLSSEDLDLVLADIDELHGLFRCNGCNTTASEQRYVPATKKISCKCGTLSLDWQK